MAHLSLNVFGSFQVFIDGVPVTSFATDKVQALLAYLAVEGGQSHRRETLVGLLWPDYPEQDARHNLRQALFNLRQVLGDHTAKPPYLFITRDAIQFNPESDASLDLAQFNAHFSTWQRSGEPVEKDYSVLLGSLETMVRLYRGEFLQHFSIEDSAVFEEWKLAQRETQHQHVMDALAYLTNAYEGQGNFRAAQQYAERQLELDPWREEAHYQLIRVFACDGKRSQALAQYEICQRVLQEELGVEPSPKTRELCEQIRRNTFTFEVKPRASVPSMSLPSLPVLLTPFVGRDKELAALGRMIADPACRCISLVALGGFGKTRLALRASELFGKPFTHGAAFVSLASVGSIDAVIPAIANAIHFAFYGPDDPRLQLLNNLRDKNMLLVVDNVEHLLVTEARQGAFTGGTIAELLMEILQHCAGIKLLVTSREALNVQAEWLFEVQGLGFSEEEQTGTKESPDPGGEFDAVTLFVQRARHIRPGFGLDDDENRTGVIRLCRLVEGMPLAIELAATWMTLLSPVEIVAEIQASLDFLTTQTRDVSDRHRSMRAVFEPTWQMLSRDEKRVLARLSVFRGGFQRQAAEQVAGATLSILSTLVTRSLLRRRLDEARVPAGRYDLHELIRQYSGAKLAEDAGELFSVQERHSLYYLGLLEKNDARLRSQRQMEALAELAGEIDNIRAAWNWSIAHQQFLPLYRVFNALWYFYELRNWFKEGEITWWHTAEALRTRAQETPDEGGAHLNLLNAALAYWAFFLFRQNRGSEAYPALLASASFLRSCPDPAAAIEPLCFLGIVCWELGKYAEAQESFQSCLEFSREYGNRWFEACATDFLGLVAYDQGAYQQALRYQEASLSIYYQIGDPGFTGHTLCHLGQTLRALGEYDQAEKRLREGLALTQAMDYRTGSGIILEALGQVAYDQGKYVEAIPFFSQSADLFREIGDHANRLSRTLSHQGLNYLALNMAVEAENAFLTALRMAQEGEILPSVLNALAGLAMLKTRQKANQEAFELVIFILQKQASTQEARMLANQLRTELEAQLAPEERKAIIARAESTSLDTIIHKFKSN